MISFLLCLALLIIGYLVITVLVQKLVQFFY